MFKVLCAPFDEKVLEEIDRWSPNAYSALVWQSEKRVKLLTANISVSPEGKERLTQRMQVTCECLNVWRSQELLKEMLRSIYYTNKHGAEIRAREEWDRTHPRKPFFYSFKGHGAMGADAWD